MRFGFGHSLSGRRRRVAATGSDTEAPSTPAGFALTGTDDGTASLAWTANSEPDLDHYNLYRSTTQGITPGPSNLLDTIAAGTETYSDTGLTNGTSYYYRLSAASVSAESDPSIEVEAIPLDTVIVPPPDPGTGGLPEWVHDGIPNGEQRRYRVKSKKGGGITEGPNVLFAYPSNGQVRLEWTEIPGAETYIVYLETTDPIEISPVVDESQWASNEATATPADVTDTAGFVRLRYAHGPLKARNERTGLALAFDHAPIPGRYVPTGIAPPFSHAPAIVTI